MPYKNKEDRTDDTIKKDMLKIEVIRKPPIKVSLMG